MSLSEQPAVPDDRRFLFVTGKGGVGKTTVSAALALSLAARGKRVLVAMCGAHERLSSILGSPPIGHDMCEVRDGVWATKIDPARAMEEYGQLIIRVRAVTRVVFENDITQSLFRAIPGIHGWAMLGKAWYHSTELSDDGSPRYDTVIFDAPSTGHGLDMLRIPGVILAVAPPGVLRRDATRAWDMLRDPTYSGVVVVSWPEELPVSETIELVDALRNELGMPLDRLIVNGALPELFSPTERESLLSKPELLEVGSSVATRSEGEWAVAAAARRAARERIQRQCFERLQATVGEPFTTLPFLMEGATTPEAADLLARALRR